MSVDSETVKTINQGIILTPAPGAVFLRTKTPVVEMSPSEVKIFIKELEASLEVSLNARDGSVLGDSIRRRAEQNKSIFCG